MKLITKLGVLCCIFALNASHANYTYSDCEPPCKEPCACPNSIFVTGEYLYWKPSQGGMPYALSVSSVNGIPLGAENTEIHQESKWGSGFRIDAGVNMPEASTDLSVSWTHFHHTAHSFNDDPFILGTQLLGPNNSFTLGGSGSGAGPAASKWNLRLDSVEFNLGYHLISGQRYMLRPYIGVAGTRLNQTQTITYTNFLDTGNAVFLNATIIQKNQFHGFGPKLGIQGDWILGNGFGLMGNLATTFYYGESKNPVEAHVLNDPIGFPLSDYVVHYEKHRVIPAFQGQVGVTWSLVTTNTLSVELSALYEVQYFVGTWRNQSSQIQNLYISDAGFENLMLNGFTGQLTISF